MNAAKIIVEIGYNNEVVYETVKNVDVLKAVKLVSKKYKDCIIFSVKTEY